MSTGLKMYLLLNKSKTNKNGFAPLYLRLKYLKQSVNVSTGYAIEEKYWQPAKGLVKTSCPDAPIINKHVQDLKLKAAECFSKMYQENNVYLGDIIHYLRGTGEQPQTLLSLIKSYNDRLDARVGTDYKRSTVQKYRVTERKLEAFLLSKGMKDIRLREIKAYFIDEFNVFMKQHFGNEQNTTYKHLKNLKTYLKYAVQMEYLQKHPFTDYKVTYRPREKPYLSLDELRSIEKKEFSMYRLQLVRDLFLFQCYTGLSFIDMYNLTGANIIVGIDGGNWIVKNREKTDIRSAIPLLPKAEELVKKYNPFYKSRPDELLFPAYSIQKFNSYLKEIADLCGITKNLSSHAGRRTFASTVALANGISIESIAQMLGHSTTKITHQYARVSDLKVATEMKKLKDII